MVNEAPSSNRFGVFKDNLQIKSKVAELETIRENIRSKIHFLLKAISTSDVLLGYFFRSARQCNASKQLMLSLLMILLATIDAIELLIFAHWLICNLTLKTKWSIKNFVIFNARKIICF